LDSERENPEKRGKSERKRFVLRERGQAPLNTTCKATPSGRVSHIKDKDGEWGWSGKGGKLLVLRGETARAGPVHLRGTQRTKNLRGY